MSTTIDDAQPRRSRRPDGHAGKGDVIPSVGDHAARRGLGSRGTGGPAVLLALLSGSLWLATPLRAEVFLRASQIGYERGDAKVAVAFSRSSLADAFAVI